MLAGGIDPMCNLYECVRSRAAIGALIDPTGIGQAFLDLADCQQGAAAACDMAKLSTAFAMIPFGGKATSLLRKSGEGVSLMLHFKAGWTDAQRALAVEKVDYLNDAAATGALSVSQAERSTKSAAAELRKTGTYVPDGFHGDHRIDLQLGGEDLLSNCGRSMEASTLALEHRSKRK